MPTDRALYLEAQAGLSAREIADMYGLSYPSVRGRLSREARKTVTHIDRLKALANPPLDTDPDVQQQRRIIEASNAAFQKHLTAHPEGVLFWLGDVHFPYANWDALRLAYELASDVNPDWITTLNDLSDFGEYSRWDKEPTPASALWSSNIDYGLDLIAAHHEALKAAAPKAALIGLNGNHDNWLLRYLRQTANGFSEKNVSYYMARLHTSGVLFFSNQSNTEPIVTLGRLKLVHGLSASSVDSTLGRKTISDLSEGGQLYHTMSGHVHRDFEVRHLGVTHTNIGCLCRFDMPYLKRPAAWTLGVGVAEYGPDYARVERVRMVYEGDYLVARYRGRVYKVKADKPTFGIV